MHLSSVPYMPHSLTYPSVPSQEYPVSSHATAAHFQGALDRHRADCSCSRGLSNERQTSNGVRPSESKPIVVLSTITSIRFTCRSISLGFQNGPDTLKALSNVRCAMMVTKTECPPNPTPGFSSSSQLLGKVGQTHHKQGRNTFRLPAIGKSYELYTNQAPTLSKKL